MFGGPGAWDDAQKAEVQCPREGCDSNEAAFFQVQIRSADEPMTSFFKVCRGPLMYRGTGANGCETVHDLQQQMERELKGRYQLRYTILKNQYIIAEAASRHWGGREYLRA